ncbi:restriction endonuclease [Streptomyces yaizuensis]|uniref:Restriction endonuclease n=1 Tax=Streptomyces yaizuensis TaxID=2989713 RepID=A0ABQ5P3D5_9ACTN|nr:restriction endonuclease [Streptomyces sp. YSPA8]
MIGAWAEAQRRQQREREAQARALQRERRERERQQRAYERDMARHHREQQAAYKRSREADAQARTGEIEARVAELSGLLAAGCRGGVFGSASLTRIEYVEPFAPGPLEHPVPMPDPAYYRPQGGGWTARARERAEWEAQERYRHDLALARQADGQRLAQLAEYRRQYDAWAGERRAEVQRHNTGVTRLLDGVRGGEPDAVVEYFSAALYASSEWPEAMPRRLSAAFDRAAAQLVLSWELPGFDVVPAARSVRYVATSDQLKEVARPVAQRRALYRDVLAQSLLLVLRDLFAADEWGVLGSVALSGFVDDVDPATGRHAEVVLGAVTVAREDFTGLRLEQVGAVECLEGLRGRLSAKPDARAAVRPDRLPGDVGAEVFSQGDGDHPDLLVMDPVEFEGLVAELFRARGMRAVTTTRSNDGGVDVEAFDPDPISGGRIIVQVKRYRHTVPPTAVRDLYGTVQDAGANKGVLVTTSGFGPGSYTFAHGKPLTLISGTDLVELLGRHGLRGRLGPAPGGPDARPVPGPGEPEAADLAPAPEDAGDGGANVLGMVWAGPVALDVCALVCRYDRVLSEAHFVFFNNESTPDGSVRAVRPSAGDRAAIRVDFDALPARADRLVLVAAVDPEVDPSADLAGFTGAGIVLRDAGGAELDRLTVSDGRAGETALVLGSFRRRAGGDWEFVVGGKGYPGGLPVLVGEYGIEVE